MQIFVVPAVVVPTAKIAAKAKNAIVACKKAPHFAALVLNQSKAWLTARIVVSIKNQNLVVPKPTKNAPNAVWPKVHPFVAK